MLIELLDRVLYRHPFEGASARRYAAAERPAFGDLDDRLLDAMGLEATGLEATGLDAMGDRPARLLDCGSGPGTFAARARARFPKLHVIALEPSHAFARQPSHELAPTVRATGEAIPLRDRCVDIAICLSSIRHVRDRGRVLRELRRVSARLWIVELDPSASAQRIANHADHIANGVRWPTGPVLRRAFGPLVVKTAPAAEVIIDLARDAGWRLDAHRDDPVQPVYILELS